jgi:hypothetical protein
MILVCLECAKDMQEIKQNVFRCPCCGWGAEQLTIPERIDEYETPKHGT